MHTLEQVLRSRHLVAADPEGARGGEILLAAVPEFKEVEIRLVVLRLLVFREEVRSEGIHQWVVDVGKGEEPVCRQLPGRRALVWVRQQGFVLVCHEGKLKWQHR